MNTKRFEVIPVEDYGVIVDKTIEKKAGLIATSCTGFDESKRFVDKIRHTLNGVCFEKCGNCFIFNHVHVVVATIGKRIEGLLLIEIPDEMVLEAARFATFNYAKAPFQDGGDAEYIQSVAFHCYLNGYKAAQSKGTYTEDDRVQAAWAGHQFRIAQEFGDKRSFTEWYGEWLNTEHPQKKKLPKAVVLEMETVSNRNKRLFNLSSDATSKDRIEYEIKITNTETNTITPKEVIYD